MAFKDPGVFLLIPIVLGILYLLKKRRREAAIHFPAVSLAHALPVSWKVKFRHLPEASRWIVLIVFLIALAGPRSVLEETVYKTEGIDIIMAIDSSGSMAAEDFTIGSRRVNRLEIVKNVVEDFIAGRTHDKIGLVTFAALAYSVSPLTTDYAWLKVNLGRIGLGLIKDGTAVGSAIASSLARLQKSEAKSKVIILLTDGMNNAGEIDPVAAARAAQTLKVKIYTIGAGTKGLVPFPVQDFYGRKIYQNVQIDLDEETLQKIASVTGGKYFRATDAQSLRQVYREIDALEKTEIEERGYFEYEEFFDRVLLVALGILLAQVILSQTLFFQVP
jgi:Ca-activated chloride channel family protein